MNVGKGIVIVLVLSALLCSATDGYSYTITAGVDGTGGAISPSGAIPVSEGGDQPFTVTPNQGYDILDVVVDGGSVGPVPSYTFSSVSADHSITASFWEPPLPAASFAADPASGAGAPVAVQFTDTSAGNPTSFLWDFGGGLTSTEQNPMAAFYLPGTYPITLTVANATGSVSVTQEYVVVACSNLFSVMVENDGSTFDTIMGAYNSVVALGLTDITLLLKGGTSAAEDLYFNADASVMLKGGYDCSFLNNYLVTTIPGSLTIAAGSLGSVIPSNIAIAALPSCSTDNDADGHTAIGSCEGAADDCDDSDQQNFPGNTESCDGRDNDCDGQIDEGLSAVDADGDGYTAIGSCGSADDCNDNNANINPGATELYGDGIDQDCDGRDLFFPVDGDCFNCHSQYWVNNVYHQSVAPPDGSCVSCHAEPVNGVLSGHYGRTVKTSGNNMPAGATIGCTSCHDWHDEYWSGYAINGDYVVWAKVTAVGYANVTCYTCHEDWAAAHAGHHPGAENDVSYNPAVDTSQTLPQGCALCHHDYDMINGTSLGLSTWETIFIEHDLDEAKDGSLNSCVNCHGYDGSSSPPLAAVQSAIASGNPATCATCHTDKVPNVDHGVPTSGKHPEHLAMAGVSCGSCHLTGNYPYFKSGTDLNGDGLYNLTETDVCDLCHQDGNGNPATGFKEGWGDPGFVLACSACHSLPPSTGAHLSHYAGTDNGLVYGDLRITQDFAGGEASATNMIGCGNCHPLDPASHGNGFWGDVELANAAAPAGSLKALSASGSYNQTTGTCSNVYCHSVNSWATDGAVPMPWPEVTGWNKNVDPLPRPLPDNIITARVYKDVTWHNGETLTCNGCHDNPPQTSYVDNDGGAGDSHYWVDPYGYENLHVWNMGFEALGCRTCHYQTVQDASGVVVDPSTNRRKYNDVGIYDKAKHVNGSVDVAFDAVNNFTYNGSYGSSVTYDLSLASYNPGTKTCSNVGCHIQETEVTWGLPYRWYDNSDECNRCHGY